MPPAIYKGINEVNKIIHTTQTLASRSQRRVAIDNRWSIPISWAVIRRVKDTV